MRAFFLPIIALIPWTLSATQQSTETHGKFAIYAGDKALGSETYRIETFDDGKTVSFGVLKEGEREKETIDSALTTRTADHSPLLYAAAYTSKGVAEDIKVTFKEKEAIIELSAGGKKVEKKSVAGTFSVAVNPHLYHHLIFPARKYDFAKKGIQKLKVFNIVRLEAMEIEMERVGVVLMKNKGLEKKLRHLSLKIGETVFHIYIGEKGEIPLIVEGREKRIVAGGFESAEVGEEEVGDGE